MEPVTGNDTPWAAPEAPVPGPASMPTLLPEEQPGPAAGGGSGQSVPRLAVFGAVGIGKHSTHQ